jgi:hypothetical protein
MAYQRNIDTGFRSSRSSRAEHEALGNGGSLQKEDFMYPAVREVIPNEDFSLNVILENGEKRLLDMKPYLDFGVFKKLREYEKFKRARVAFDTIEWDEGVDLDPEFVYEKSKPIKRFDVYLIDLDPTVGSEIKKTRPCLIISPDEMNRTGGTR